MQLKNKRRESATLIAKKLSAATGALLGGVAPGVTHAADGSKGDWDFETAVLYYAESGNRVNAVEPVIKARRYLGDDEFLDLKLVVDSLTGSTPTGAVPTTQVQTYTRPSGNGTYTVTGGEVPLDDTFHDTRTALSANWEKPFSRFSKGNFGINFSNEFDFRSQGVNANFSHDFNQRNTTLSLGFALENDTIDPLGGIPLELSTVASAAAGGGNEDDGFEEGDDDAYEGAGNDDLPANRRATSDSRDQVDLLLGLTQIISPRTIMQFNISHSESNGYHNDPYKVISIVDAAPGPNQGEPLENIYESRPDSRSKTAFYWETRHSFDRDAIGFSYRYMSDDWGIKSHTAELRYFLMMDDGSYWQPHLRYYQQSAADFYRTLLLNSEPVPQYVSADYRLGDMTGITYGLKYSHLLENDKRVEFRLEMMSQTNDPSPGSRIGNQANRKLILDTDALIFQVSYSF